MLENIQDSIVQAYKNSGASADSVMEYTPYGIQATSYEDYRHSYTGREFDYSSDTYYYRSRYYTPESGRFNRLDDARDGVNWYLYVGNDPVNFVDPFGEKVWLSKYEVYTGNDERDRPIYETRVALHQETYLDRFLGRGAKVLGEVVVDGRKNYYLQDYITGELQSLPDVVYADKKSENNYFMADLTFSLVSDVVSLAAFGGKTIFLGIKSLERIDDTLTVTSSIKTVCEERKSPRNMLVGLGLGFIPGYSTYKTLSESDNLYGFWEDYLISSKYRLNARVIQGK